MAYKEDGEWVFDKKEVDQIFEKAMNKKLKPKGSLSESEIMEIARELDVDPLTMKNAIIDIKTSSDIFDIVGSSEKNRHPGPGGTKGGFKSFLVGMIMTISGGYLLTNHVQVSSIGFITKHFEVVEGIKFTPFGVTLIPLILGIGMLFFNGKSKIGWFLTGGSALGILLGIITTLDIRFPTTSLYITLAMFVLFFGGLGLVARSLKAFND